MSVEWDLLDFWTKSCEQALRCEFVQNPDSLYELNWIFKCFQEWQKYIASNGNFSQNNNRQNRNWWGNVKMLKRRKCFIWLLLEYTMVHIFKYKKKQYTSIRNHTNQDPRFICYTSICVLYLSHNRDLYLQAHLIYFSTSTLNFVVECPPLEITRAAIYRPKFVSRIELTARLSHRQIENFVSGPVCA